jgi:large subunit ribosomal protein L18
MGKTNPSYVARKRRHSRVRRKLSGTSERPRLNVFRSLNHIYAQVIDDSQGATLVAASSLDTSIRDSEKEDNGRISQASLVGKLIAERAKETGINEVVFDRGGYRYHGRVKALAEAAREAGLKF